MRLFPLLFLTAGIALAQPAVRDGGAVLYDSCNTGSRAVAKLDAGEPVRISFALSGERGNCLKVQVESGGKTLQGYVEANGLTGLDSFERARRSASEAREPQEIRAAIGAVSTESPQTENRPGAVGGGNIARALSLLERGEPREALSILESALKSHGDDPALLAAAGVAAYQSDDPRKALYYWRNSQRLRPNPSVERLIQRADREMGADSSDHVIHGARFVLRYEAATADATQAGGMLAVLEEEYNRISGQLGCQFREQTVAIVQSPEAYRTATAAAEWSAGQYDGRIHIPLATGTITPEIREVFAHEIVHACLTTLGRWPTWFQEGMAQYHTGHRISAAVARQIAALAKEGQMPGLGALSQSFSSMSSQHAALAYALSLEAVETLYREFGPGYVRNLLHNPQSMPAAEAELTRRFLPTN